jgi:trigger factor
MYGQSLLTDEVIKMASRELELYIINEKLELLGQPMMMEDRFININVEKPDEVNIDFEIGLVPVFNIPALQNNETITYHKVKVTGEMVDNEITRTRLRYGNRLPLNTITAKDEIVAATVEACDENGAVTEGTEAKQISLRLDRFPEKLQALLMNKMIDESVFIRPCDVAEGEALHTFIHDIKANHGDETANFKIHIKEVSIMEPAELTPEFFQSVFQNTEINTVEEFAEMMKKELEYEYGKVSMNKLQDELYEKLIHETPLELPVEFMKRWMRTTSEEKMTDEEVEKKFPEWDHGFRWSIISSKIRKENNIHVSNEEVMNAMKVNVLKYFGIENEEDAPWMNSYIEQMKKDKKTIENTHYKMLDERLFQFLFSKFTVMENEVSEQEFYKLHNPYHQEHHHHH